MISSTFHAEDIWRTLVRATVDKKHPWRTPALCTQSFQGPNSRHVVLRGVDVAAAELLFFTDARSCKVSDIAQDPRVSVLFWNPKAMQQLRVWGKATVIDETSVLDPHWARVPEGARRDYATLSAPGEGYRGEWLDLAEARINFRLLKVACHRMDDLVLRREGHLRVAYSRNLEGRWDAERVEA